MKSAIDHSNQPGAAQRPVIDFDRPRVKGFRKFLLDSIPCNPVSARQELEELRLADLVICYLNWRDRFLQITPRKVVTWDGLINHGCFHRNRKKILEIAALIEKGVDLTPYLSERIVTHGYVGKSTRDKPKRGIEWEDKDYALNAFNLHHLHFWPLTARKSPKRSRDLLFASFSREQAFILMVGDHNSFSDGTLEKAYAEYQAASGQELKGLLPGRQTFAWNECKNFQRRGVSAAFYVGDKVVMGAGLTSAGTAGSHTMHSIKLMDLLRVYEYELDKGQLLKEWYALSNRSCPDNPELIWAFHHCDFGLFDASTGFFFAILQWKR